jgi:hypothetical protein
VGILAIFAALFCPGFACRAGRSFSIAAFRERLLLADSVEKVGHSKLPDH